MVMWSIMCVAVLPLLAHRGDLGLVETVVGEDLAAVLAEAWRQGRSCGGAHGSAQLPDRAERAAVDREEDAALAVERMVGELVGLEHRLAAAVVGGQVRHPLVAGAGLEDRLDLAADPVLL